MRLQVPELREVRHMADASHYWAGRPYGKPVFIGLHATAANNDLEQLTTRPGSEASAHFWVPRTGDAVRVVDDGNAAWTNGPSTVYVVPGRNVNPNWRALTIEVDNLNDGKQPYTAAQVLTTARICVVWWARYGYLPINPHWLIQSNKRDPMGWPGTEFSDHLFRIVAENYR